MRNVRVNGVNDRMLRINGVNDRMLRVNGSMLRVYLLSLEKVNPTKGR